MSFRIYGKRCVFLDNAFQHKDSAELNCEKSLVAYTYVKLESHHTFISMTNGRVSCG
jgi:hypothetical protein